MRFALSFLSAVLSLSIGSLPAFGETDDLAGATLEDLMNINVRSATKTDVSVFQSPVAVSVITRADLERTAARSLPEALRTVVGIHTVSIQSGQHMLASRGGNVFAPAKILLLIDGQPIDPTLFSTTWWDLVPVSLNDIERIEVIRSPGTIYGENAENGVINIITTTHKGMNVANTTKAELRYGEQAYQQLYAGHLYQSEDKKFKARGSVELNQINPYTTTDPHLIIAGQPKTPTGEQRFADDKPQGRLQKISFGANYEIDAEQDMDFSAGFNNIETARGRVPDRLCFVNMQGHTGFANARYAMKSEGSEQQFSAGVNQNLFTFTKNSDTLALDEAGLKHTRMNFGYELKLKWASQNLLIGVNPTLESAANNSGVAFLTGQTVNNSVVTSVPIQYQLDISDRDRLFVGGLYSSHYVAGTNFSPMVSYTHKLSDQYVLRAGVHASHRNPNVFEHSMDYDQPTGETTKRTTMRSNRNLKAQRTLSYEMGVRAIPSSQLVVTLDAYYQQVRDGIEWQSLGANTAPARPIYQSVNGLDQEIQGAELEATYQFNGHFSVGFNTAVTQIKNTSKIAAFSTGNGAQNLGQGRYGDDYYPNYNYKVFTDYRIGPVNTRVDFQHTDASNWQWPGFTGPATDNSSIKPVVPYNVVNASVTYNAFENASLSIEGLNLLDERHTEWRGDETYFGRIVWLRLNAQM